jgi:hypothetical protein
MYRLLILGALTVALTGCGGNVKQISCAGNDWLQLGYDTAMAGKSVRSFDTYRKQCAENLEKEAMTIYLDGYTRGVMEYCTYDNGFVLGGQNKAIKNICPPELRTLFDRGYNVGLAELKTKMRDLDQITEERDRNPNWNTPPSRE